MDINLLFISIIKVVKKHPVFKFDGDLQVLKLCSTCFNNGVLWVHKFIIIQTQQGIWLN